MKIVTKIDEMHTDKTGFMRKCFFTSGLALICWVLAAGRIGNGMVVYSGLMILILIQLFLLYYNDKFLKLDEAKQMFPVYLFFAIFMDAAFVGGGFVNVNTLIGRFFFLFCTLFFNLGAYFLFDTVINMRVKKERESLSFRKILKKNKILATILAMFLLFSADILLMGLRLDPWIYYKEIVEAASWDFNLISLAPLGVCGHYAYGFTLWMLIGEFLIPYNGLGVQLVQIAMGLITIFCTYKILQKVCRNRGLVLVGTAIFAFSPAFGGIIGEICPDYALVCFFIWMFCCHLYGYQLLEIASGVFLCLSKETALFVYAGYMLGILITDILAYLKVRGNKTTPLSGWETSRMCIPGLLFILAFFSAGFKSWQPAYTPTEILPTHRVNAFNFDPTYIGMELENLYVMHFAWVITGISLIMFLFLFIKKRKELFSEDILILVLSDTGFIFFSLIYVTFTHYRYIQAQHFFATVIFIYFLGKLNWKRAPYILAGFILALLFLENYYIADPLTKAIYPNVEIGNTQAVSTCRFVRLGNEGNRMERDPGVLKNTLLQNGICNNRQYVYLSKVLNIALNDIKYDDETGLLIPFAFGGNSYVEFFGKSLPDEMGWICYDSKMHVLMLNNAYVYQGREDRIPFNVFWVRNPAVLPDMGGVQYRDLYYIAYPFCEEDNTAFKRTHEILEVKEYSLMGWRIQLYKVAQ